MDWLVISATVGDAREFIYDSLQRLETGTRPNALRKRAYALERMAHLIVEDSPRRFAQFMDDFLKAGFTGKDLQRLATILDAFQSRVAEFG